MEIETLLDEKFPSCKIYISNKPNDDEIFFTFLTDVPFDVVLQGLDTIKEQILEVTTEEPKLQGQIKTELFKKLGVEGFDPSKFTTTINLVKSNKPLNLAANKILADTMIAMIKTNDDNLLTQIFSNLKQIEVK